MFVEGKSNQKLVEHKSMVDPRILPRTESGKICLGNPKTKDQARIYANVTMDCFHFGHVNFLRQCKELCRKKFPELNPYFIAGLISDEKCTILKRVPLFNWEERAAIIYNCKYVDDVIKIGHITPKEIIDEMEIDLIVSGSDHNKDMIEFDYPGSSHLHEYAKYTEGISTSDTIARVKGKSNQELVELKSKVDPRILPRTESGKIWLGDPKKKDQARVYVNVTMDCFHFGHVNFLRKCKELCKKKFPELNPYLIAGLCSDEDCTKLNRVPFFTWEERAAIVYNCKYVDDVIKIGHITSKELIIEMEIDLVVTGSDCSKDMVEHNYPGSSHLHEFLENMEGTSTSNTIARITARMQDDDAPPLGKKL